LRIEPPPPPVSRALRQFIYPVEQFNFLFPMQLLGRFVLRMKRGSAHKSPGPKHRQLKREKSSRLAIEKIAFPPFCFRVHQFNGLGVAKVQGFGQNTNFLAIICVKQFSTSENGQFFTRWIECGT